MKHQTSSVFVFRRLPGGWRIGLIQHPRFRRMMIPGGHVEPEESVRLGVESGWYSTKVSGTFVTGPHATLEECVSKIAELNPPPAKRWY